MDIKKLKEFVDMPKSYWIASTGTTNYPVLNKNINVDVAIVGGGIVGIATAYQLQKNGIEVAIIEGGRIAESTTGHTTAKITSQHNLIYAKLIKQFGLNLAGQYATANELAIQEIKKLITENNIDCDYHPEPAFVFIQDETYVKKIMDEVEAAQSLGIGASFATKIPIPIQINGAIRFDNQAQFHPRKFLLSIAEMIHKAGAQIYEQSRVLELDQNDEDKYILTTSNGYIITANKVVIASRYPFYNKLVAYHVRISQVRTYAIVLKVKEKFPGGMYVNAEQPNRSLRGLSTDSGEYVLVVGNSHKAGQSDDTNKQYETLIDFAATLFTIEDVPYRWSTQDCMTVDGVPYIGRFSVEKHNLYIATGFNKWGITNGVVSSILLKDLIIKGSSLWEKVYDPLREIRLISLPLEKQTTGNIVLLVKRYNGYLFKLIIIL